MNTTITQTNNQNTNAMKNEDATTNAGQAVTNAVIAQMNAEKAALAKIVERYELKGKTYNGTVCSTIRELTTDSKGKIGADEIRLLLIAGGIENPSTATIRTQQAQARKDLGYKGTTRQTIGFTL